MSIRIKFKNNTYLGTESIAHGRKTLKDIIYPVGSVYVSWTSTSPASLYGGSWTRLKGGFIYGVESNSSSAGNGTGTYTNNHTLTIDEIPPHKHTTTNIKGTQYQGTWSLSTAQYSGQDINNNLVGSTGGGKGHTHSLNTTTTNTGSTGSGTALNTMPPYLAVYMWKRTG